MAYPTRTLKVKPERSFDPCYSSHIEGTAAHAPKFKLAENLPLAAKVSMRQFLKQFAGHQSVRYGPRPNSFRYRLRI